MNEAECIERAERLASAFGRAVFAEFGDPLTVTDDIAVTILMASMANYAAAMALAGWSPDKMRSMLRQITEEYDFGEPEAANDDSPPQNVA